MITLTDECSNTSVCAHICHSVSVMCVCVCSLTCSQFTLSSTKIYMLLGVFRFSSLDKHKHIHIRLFSQSIRAKVSFTFRLLVCCCLFRMLFFNECERKNLIVISITRCLALCKLLLLQEQKQKEEKTFFLC